MTELQVFMEFMTSESEIEQSSWKKTTLVNSSGHATKRQSTWNKLPHNPLPHLPPYPFVGCRLPRAPAHSSTGLLRFIDQLALKSCEILMFVCLLKDAKQCCDASKFIRTHCAGQRCHKAHQHNEYDHSLWHHSLVWHLFGDKQTSKSHET